MTKQGRAPTLLLTADAIRDPDEVWASLDVIRDGADTPPRLRLVRRYIAWFEAPDRQRNGFVVFETGPDGWRGITAYELRADRPSVTTMLDTLDCKRVGILLYRRKVGG